jgi:hypothetical protein
LCSGLSGSIPMDLTQSQAVLKKFQNSSNLGEQ